MATVVTLLAPRSVRSPILLAAIVVSVGLIINIFNSFGIDEAADTATGQVVGALASPLYGGAARSGQAEIAIVTIDSDTLRRLGENRWPIPYADQADIVEAVARFAPKAIFVDLYFGEAREPPEAVADLARRLNRVGNQTPLVVGPVNTDDPGLAPLAGLRQAGIAAPAGVSTGLYPLTDPQGRTRAAAILFDLWCAERPQEPACAAAGSWTDDTRPLALEWGFGTSPAIAAMQPELERGNCGVGDLGDRARAFGRVLLRGMFHDVVEASGDRALYFACPYHDTVPAHWLFDPAMADTVRAFLGDRVVLIGADVPWLADNFETPLLGTEPGVAFHAMALDNLIENGVEVRRAPRTLFYGLDVADAIEAALIFLASVVAVLLLRLSRYTAMGAAACWAAGSGVVVAGCAAAFVFLQFPALNICSVGLGAVLATWVASTRARSISFETQETEA